MFQQVDQKEDYLVRTSRMRILKISMQMNKYDEMHVSQKNCLGCQGQ